MIGSNSEPGVSSTVDSAPSVSAAGDSPGVPLIVGSADLNDGEANAAEVYSVEDSAQAQTLFGKESRLTRNVLDARSEGASPILAVATPESTVTQDISALASTSGSLDEPAKESADLVTVTVDGTTKSVEYYLETVANKTVETDKAYFNPTNGNFELDGAPSNSGSIEYTALDYQAALQAVVEYTGDVDFITALKERSGVTTHVLGAANDMASAEKTALAVASVPTPVDANAFTNSYDDSRLQLWTPGRTDDFGSTLGAFVGMRANVGITTTPINQRLSLRARPAQELGETDRSTLIDKNVTPAERIGESLRVADDVNTVSDSNSEEANIQYATTRLVVDFLIDTIHLLEKPFIGKFNSPGAIEQLSDLLNKEARPLSQSNVIYSYNAEVTMIDPTTARVVFNADVAEPIRFIENEFVLGNDLSLQSA